MGDASSPTIEQLSDAFLPKLATEIQRLLLPLFEMATRGTSIPGSAKEQRADVIQPGSQPLPLAASPRVSTPTSENHSSQTSPALPDPLVIHAAPEPTNTALLAALREEMAPSHAAAPLAPVKSSYAKALVNHKSEAMKPVHKGMYLTVAVDEQLYKEGVSELRDSLIGRIIHAGDVWRIKTPWSLTPVGEGYYNIRFNCNADREKIFDRRSGQLKPGLLRLQHWVPDFNPYRVNTSVVQAWIRISELPLEYWNKHIITALASAVGTVIKIDERTLSRTMWRFARVLVELDLKHDREETLMFEREGHCSFVSIQYEHLPEFCKFYSVIGHAIGYCGRDSRRRKPSTEAVISKKDDRPPDAVNGTVSGTKQWVQKTFHASEEGAASGTDPSKDTAAGFHVGAPEKQPQVGSVQDKTLETGDQMPVTGHGAQPGLQCRNSFTVLDETDEGETEMLVSDTTNTIAEVEDSVAGVVNLTREGQLLVHLPSIEEDNARTSLSLHPAGDICIEEHTKGMKQRAHLVAKEYNLWNRHSDETARDGVPSHRPGPDLVIPEDNSTRPLKTMHNITRERWSDYVDDLPPKHGHTEACDYVGRRALWQYIADLHCNNLCLIGDFNAVLGAHERHSSHAPNGVSCADFRRFIERKLLFEVEAVGAAFTWASRRSSIGLIASKLDRVLAHEGFINHWNSVSATIAAAKQVLSEVHAQVYDLGDSEDLFNKEIEATVELNQILTQEQFLYAQKNRATWLRDGDRNTAFFQRLHRIKKAKSGINAMLIDGNLTSDQATISAHNEQFYVQLFSASIGPADGVVPDLITPSITSDISRKLSDTPGLDEIKAVVFGLSGDSNPGPDGFGGFV
ncbi:hypothetical protein ACS0TY_036760 [Phlomoides rotata]